jgi:hypothetical protein
MVQFYNKHKEGVQANNYWKLHRDEWHLVNDILAEMKKKNFTVLKRTTTPHIKALYVRYQRGLLSYEGLSIDELKCYAAQRSLPPITGRKRITIPVVKAQLERADEECTFARFTDLPPEIRSIVYTHYFKSFHHDEGDDNICSHHHESNGTRSPFACLKSQPPITFACREIRLEALPLFYECCEFCITTTNSILNLNGPFAYGRTTADFMQSMSASDIGRLRVLCVDISEFDVVIALDLNNKKKPLQVEMCPGYSREEQLHQTLQHSKERMLSDLHTIAIDIAARDGPLKLREADLKRLYDTARSTLRQLSIYW